MRKAARATVGQNELHEWDFIAFRGHRLLPYDYSTRVDHFLRLAMSPCTPNRFPIQSPRL